MIVSDNIFDKAVEDIEKGEKKTFTKLIKSSPDLVAQQHSESQYTFSSYFVCLYKSFNLNTT